MLSVDLRVRDYDFIVTGILQKDESLMKSAREWVSTNEWNDFNGAEFMFIRAENFLRSSGFPQRTLRE